MHRIDGTTASTILPAPKPIGAPGFFTAGTVGGQAATIVEADWLNTVQEELLAILAAAAIAPSKATNTQVIAAILQLIANNTRRRLVAPLDLYVATTGSDLNDGLTPSTPFATPQAAWNYIIAKLDCGGQTITVHIADGTYGFLTLAGTPVGSTGQAVVFSGDMANPLAVTIDSTAPGTAAITLTDGALAYFQGLNILTTGGGTWGIYAWQSVAFIANCNFGPCNSPHICADEGSLVTLAGSYTINGGAPAHLESAHGALVTAAFSPTNTITVTVTGTPTFSTAFAYCFGGASIHTPNAYYHFTGPANGPRYNVTYNGSILTNGGGANFFPGSVAGTADAATFGTYMP